MEELTDYETKSNGWIDRKSKFNVPKYGNACIFVEEHLKLFQSLTLITTQLVKLWV